MGRDQIGLMRLVRAGIGTSRLDFHQLHPPPPPLPFPLTRLHCKQERRQGSSLNNGQDCLSCGGIQPWLGGAFFTCPNRDLWRHILEVKVSPDYTDPSREVDRAELADSQVKLDGLVDRLVWVSKSRPLNRLLHCMRNRKSMSTSGK